MAKPKSITDARAANRENNRRWREKHRARKNEQATRWYAKKRAARLAAKALAPPRTTKRCARCETEKPFAEFGANRHIKDGRHSYCKACAHEQRIAWNAAHLEKKRAYSRRWDDAHRPHKRKREAQRYRRRKADHPAQVLAEGRRFKKQWRLNHPALARENDRKSRARYRETVLRCMRAWGHAHRPTKNAHEMARRARKHAAFVEVVDPAVVFARGNGICGICREPVDPAEPWHVDHIRPLSKGGEHSYANTQLAHAACNLSKGVQHVA